MIDIPIGKALVPVEAELSSGNCNTCDMSNRYKKSYCRSVCCARHEREDGKYVVFKLVDWPAKEEK
jgi:hypothetical protein